MPIYFIENRGQLDSRVAYYVQRGDTALYFTADGMTLVQTDQRHGENGPEGGLEKTSLVRNGMPTPEAGSRWAVKLDFVGANPSPSIQAKDPTPAIVSYFKGPKENWKAALSTYGSIIYSDLWPGIDLVYSGTANRLKYTFLVKPGADSAQVRLAYRGVHGIRLNEAGQLEIETPAGRLQDDKPYAFQEIDGRRVQIDAAYSLDPLGAAASYRYGFAIGSYDRAKPLVLDPTVLVYCGYIGGSGFDQGRSIAVDTSGNAYVTGRTGSSEPTFPVTVGPDLTYNGGGVNGNTDAFVAKVNAAGTALVYCGYIGGGDYDEGYGIAVDSSGNAYVTGVTSSTEATFPVTVGPGLTFGGGTYDAFVAKVNAAGTALVYCGYIGGSGGEQGNGIAVDSSGNAYVTGQTSSAEDTFPVTVGPDLTFNGPFGGGSDAFVAKVNAAGTALVYCGYIGGGYADAGYGIAVDSSDNAYLTGLTQSPETFPGLFPVTVGPALTYSGGEDAFVAKVNAAGTALVYCGYIGGTGLDQGTGIAVGSSGNAYVIGTTSSTETTFPVTVGPNPTYNGGPHDTFLAKVNAAGTALDYCGYIGGSGNDFGRGIAVDSLGNAYATGETTSTEATFPVMVGPDLTFNGPLGGSNAFVAKVNAAGTTLVYCGYIGGSKGGESGQGIAVDSSGNAYVTGSADSDETTFPVTAGPDLTFDGGSDAFVAKIGTSCLPRAGPLASNNGPICAGHTLQLAASPISGATYNWTGPNSFTSNLQNPTILAATSAAAGTYSVTATVGGCTSPAGTTAAVVNPTPATPVITAPANTAGGTRGLSASVVPHAGGSWFWTVQNGTVTAGQGTSQITFTAGSIPEPLTLSVMDTNASGCVSAPGIASVAIDPFGPPYLFYTVTPCRVLDTRNPAGPLGGPALQAGAMRTFDVATSRCGIPSGAVAISANLTVTNVGSLGELLAFASDAAPTNASSLSFRPGRTRANNAMVSLSKSSATFSIFNNSASTVDFILDVNGYFQ